MIASLTPTPAHNRYETIELLLKSKISKINQALTEIKRKIE